MCRGLRLNQQGYLRNTVYPKDYHEFDPPPSLFIVTPAVDSRGVTSSGMAQNTPQPLHAFRGVRSTRAGVKRHPIPCITPLCITVISIYDPRRRALYYYKYVPAPLGERITGAQGSIHVPTLVKPRKIFALSPRVEAKRHPILYRAASYFRGEICRQGSKPLLACGSPKCR